MTDVSGLYPSSKVKCASKELRPACISPLQSLYGYAAFIKRVFNLDCNDSRDICWRILLGKAVTRHFLIILYISVSQKKAGKDVVLKCKGDNVMTHVISVSINEVAVNSTTFPELGVNVLNRECFGQHVASLKKNAKGKVIGIRI